MPELLISVRSASEAEAAVCGGADIIDIKEPLRGPLGRPDDAVVSAVVAAVAGRRAVSVALGELDAIANDDRRCIPPLAGVRYAKCGPAGCAEHSDWHVRWRDVRDHVMSAHCGRIAMAAVAYADSLAAAAPHPAQILDLAVEAECEVFLLDTWTKDGRGVFDAMSIDELIDLRHRCRHHSIRMALAGSLRAEDRNRIETIAPDIVAIRGAACHGGRRDRAIDPALVQSWALRVHAMHSSDNSLQVGRIGS